MDLIRGDKQLRKAVQNRPSNPPIIFADGIVEARSFRGPGKGYTFFHGRGAGRRRSRS